MRRIGLSLWLAACSAGDSNDSVSEVESGWRSALYPESWVPGVRDAEGRALHDFSYAGYRGGEEPPEARGPVFSVLEQGADPTGESDSTEAVQQTIDLASTAGGGIVLLPEGLYRLDEQIEVRASGVVIRGEGPERTRLAFTRDRAMTDRAMITFRGSLTYGDPVPLTLDASAFDVQLRTADALALPVGSEVAVGWEITPDFVEEHGMTGTWTVFVGQWKPIFRREITGRDPSSGAVDLDVPLRYRALRRDAASVRVERGHLYEVGVEALAISTAVDWGRAWEADRSHAILFRGVVDGWVRGVHSFESPFPEDGRGRHLQSGGIKILDSKRVTVKDCDLRLAQNRGTGGNGYLYEVSRSSEILFRDSAGVGGRHNFIQNWDFGTTGCVWHNVHSAEGRSLVGQSSSVGTVGYSEYHHSLAMANLVDSVIADDGWAAVNRGSFSSGAGHSATESVFWNTRGSGTIRSFQYGHGYVVGTEEVTVQVDLDTPDIFGATEGTAPADWLEGEGEAATLEPQSLYLDQRDRRLTR